MPPLVLVAEDEPAVRRITCQYLEEAGFHCEEAGFHCIDADDAAHAQNLLAAGAIPDLLVLDVRLPGTSGPELALQIDARYPSIPVLFVSGWAEGWSTGEKLVDLRWEYVQKPYAERSLVGAARRLLSAVGSMG